MRILRDHLGRQIRLTDERLRHALAHPEMRGMESGLAETLARPEIVVRSRSDPEVRLYYKTFAQTPVSEKHLCVVVKDPENPTRSDTPDSMAAFVITGYLTDAIKKGEILWRPPEEQ
ncbi:MAG: hypothetical protein M3Q49_11905 [Actinomycetota bacterium]|nr:hypothetical protein [Actinomycetota bacterium]